MFEKIEEMRKRCSDFKIHYDYSNRKWDNRWELDFTYRGDSKTCEARTIERLISFAIEEYECFSDLR